MTTKQSTKKSKAKNPKNGAIQPEAASASQQMATSNLPAETGAEAKIAKLKKPAKTEKAAITGKASKIAAVKALRDSKKAKTAAARANQSPAEASKAAPKAAAKDKPVKTDAKPKTVAKPKTKDLAKAGTKADAEETAKVLDSVVAYEGPLFRVLRDHIIEPGGRESHRDVIRHNGSVVILAVDHGKKKKDPWIVIERQYRHAAGQFLWELPAGKLDAGETPVDGAKRELSEETGYQAKKWSQLMEYFASPGFLGESMKVFLAEGLVAGDAHPEEDEHIDFRLVKLSEVLELVDKGKIIDGKTLTSVLLYARQLGVKRKN
jgi:ADP-ribose pyrophosphatase